MPLSESSCDDRLRDGELPGLEELPWLDEPCWLEEPRSLDEPCWLEEPRSLGEPLIPEERSDDVRPDMPEPPEVSAAPLIPPLEPARPAEPLPIPLPLLEAPVPLPEDDERPLVPPLELRLDPSSLSAELPIPSSFRLPRSVRAPSDESRSLELEALRGESLLRVLESDGVDLPTFCDERSRSLRSSLRFAMCFLHLLRWCAVHRHSSGVGARNV